MDHDCRYTCAHWGCIIEMWILLPLEISHQKRKISFIKTKVYSIDVTSVGRHAEDSHQASSSYFSLKNARLQSSCVAKYCMQDFHFLYTIFGIECKSS